MGSVSAIELYLLVRLGDGNIKIHWESDIWVSSRLPLLLRLGDGNIRTHWVRVRVRVRVRVSTWCPWVSLECPSESLETTNYEHFIHILLLHFL